MQKSGAQKEPGYVWFSLREEEQESIWGRGACIYIGVGGSNCVRGGELYWIEGGSELNVVRVCA